ncbi:hypothetical protein ACWDOR_23175 [Streptosporangium canum]
MEGVHMAVAAQFVTLLAVVVGAITSFVVTLLNERLRFRREQVRNWTDKRLEVYAEYLNAVKQMNQLSRRISAARGIGAYAQKLEGEEGLALLAEAEGRRANAAEMVALVGGGNTIAAVRDLNQEIRRLEWIARGLLQPDAEAWEACNQAYVKALNSVHKQIREELRIPGAFLPRALGRPATPVLPRPTADQDPS